MATIEDFRKKYCEGTVTINGKEYPYSQTRIRKADIPEGWHRYQVRWSDDWEDWATIEPFVMVNHAADILSEEEITFPPCGYIEIDEWSF